jgi:hypothetical protein
VAPALLVIGLTPAPDFSRFLGELRARYPEAALTALIGNPELRSGQPQADHYLLWSEFPPRALATELRRRRFALHLIVFNPEYRYTLPYWKALALAAAARAPAPLLCPQGRLPHTAPASSELPGGWLKRTLGWVSLLLRQGVGLLAFGLLHLSVLLLALPLLLVFLGILTVDLGVVIARLFRRPAGTKPPRSE